MAYLVAGPFVALVGIVTVFFVLRRKSVEKRSMYSSRRSQIEHKVRAARQRTLAPHGRGQKPQEQTIPAATSTFATQAPGASVSWETPAYAAPPVAPPSAPPSMPPPPPSQEAPSSAPWDVPASAPAPAFDYPPAPPYAPPAAEPFRPAPEPTPMAPSEPVWTPAPAPAVERAAQMEPAAATAASSTAAGAWSIVSPAKETAGPEPDGKKKKKKDKGGAETATGSWSLASGDAPGAEADEPLVGRPSGTAMAVAQYAVLVIGLVMVLIGVLVMVANSHVT